MTMSPNEKKTILKKLHHTTKLELWQKVTDLQAKRMEAEDRAKELESDLETIREEFHSRVEKILKLEKQVEGLGRDCSHQDQVMKDLQQELKTTKSNAAASFKQQTDEIERNRNLWFKASDKVQKLEKLLVYNGKAIGALSDLAADKFKHDDLPF